MLEALASLRQREIPVFDGLELLPEDPILGLLSAFRDDPSQDKLDLGVGVYKDERGLTPVLRAVRTAEIALIQEQVSKTYVGPAGNAQFNTQIAALVLGSEHPAILSGRVRALQAPGGCGALRIGAELATSAGGSRTVHVSDPTWANHVPLLQGAGLKLETYPYYDTRTGSVKFDSMLEQLRSLPAGDIVLLHGSCHNPTGADLSPEQWQTLVPILLERGLVPFIDLAYQGLGDGIDQDASGARLVASAVPEALIAVSCSKNFGLYRERVGALVVVAQNASQADAAASHLRRIARGLYSMPPDHGAAIVARILSDPQLSEDWTTELSAMRERILMLRRALARALTETCPQRFASAVERQRGMFSILDLAPAAIDTLRQKHHIYMTRDGRINIAGLRLDAIQHLASAVGTLVDPS